MLQSLPLGCALPGSTPEQATVLAPSATLQSCPEGGTTPLGVQCSLCTVEQLSYTVSAHLPDPDLDTDCLEHPPDSHCLVCFGGIFPHWSCGAHHPLGDVASSDLFIAPLISHSDPIIIPFTHFEPSQTAIEAAEGSQASRLEIPLSIPDLSMCLG